MLPLLLGLAVLASGCRSTGYLAQRRRDLADVVTATTGPAVGAKLRLGPLHLTPVLWAMEMAGLRGGEWFYRPTLGMEERVPAQEVGRIWWAVSLWDLPAQPRLRQRGKAHIAAPLFLGPEAKLYDAFTDTPPFLSLPRLQWPAEKLAVERYPAAYLTQAEVSVGLLWGVSLGVNPGEALDFLLGWFRVDIYRDDLWGVPPAEAPMPLSF